MIAFIKLILTLIIIFIMTAIVIHGHKHVKESLAKKEFYFSFCLVLSILTLIAIYSSILIAFTMI